MLKQMASKSMTECIVIKDLTSILKVCYSRRLIWMERVGRRGHAISIANNQRVEKKYPPPSTTS